MSRSRVLVVVASRLDEGARTLADRWTEVRVLTCEDLSVAGWRHRLGGTSTAVVGGEMVTATEIEGVLTRRSRVLEWELDHIVPGDRAYVAAEMTAFLRSWLSGLGCPVLNKPVTTCLSGPGWCREQWVFTAVRLGIPARPVRWRLGGSADAPEAAFTATVVGDRCLGAADSASAAWALRLARAAGVDLLAARFGEAEAGFELLGADPWPDVSSPEVADAILEYLGDDRRC
jgi:hypothetical protein